MGVQKGLGALLAQWLILQLCHLQQQSDQTLAFLQPVGDRIDEKSKTIRQRLQEWFWRIKVSIFQCLIL